MLFNSLGFIFVFLPLCLFAFYAIAHRCGGRAGIQVLIAASLIFYGMSNLSHLLLLLVSIVVNYWLGFRLQRKPNKWLLILGLVGNLLALAYYKYADFAIENFNYLLNVHFDYWGVILPIGISFYTFQQISYLIDSHRQQLRANNFQEYMLFVAFFPQLIAGPIVRFQELSPQFSQPNFGVFCWGNLNRGITLFAIGLCKKVILADSLAQEVTPIFERADAGLMLSQPEAWLGLLSYSLQIYFDFSAYSDMAIGLGLMMGIRLPENFLSPYKAENIIDFWRRWHITLSRFLRDYVYISLGGNRRGEARQRLNLVLVMLIGGLWHGAHWNFVIWGGLHGFYLLVSHYKNKYYGSNDSKSRTTKVFNILLTFLLVSLAWAFFRAHTFTGALTILSGLVSITNADFVYDIFREALLPLAPYFFIIWFLPNSMELMKNLEKYWNGDARAWSSTLVALATASGLSVCCFYIFSGSYSEFIYFQF